MERDGAPWDEGIERLLDPDRPEDQWFDRKASAFLHTDGSLKPKQVDDVMETVTSFLNTEGGVVVIGVDDAGEVVGVEKDASHLRRATREHWGNALLDQLDRRLGQEVTGLVRLEFEWVGGRSVAFIRCSQAQIPVKLRQPPEKRGAIYIRRNGASIPVDSSRLALHWSRRRNVPAVDRPPGPSNAEPATRTIAPSAREVFSVAPEVAGLLPDIRVIASASKGQDVNRTMRFEFTDELLPARADPPGYELLARHVLPVRIEDAARRGITIDDGPAVDLIEAAIDSRPGPDGRVTCRLAAAPTSYFRWVLTGGMLDAPLPDFGAPLAALGAPTLRDLWGDEPGRLEELRAIAPVAMIGVAVVVADAERILLVERHRQYVASAAADSTSDPRTPLHVLAEGMLPSDCDASGRLSFDACARRTIRDELRMDPSWFDLKLTSVCLDQQRMQPVVTYLATLARPGISITSHMDLHPDWETSAGRALWDATLPDSALVDLLHGRHDGYRVASNHAAAALLFALQFRDGVRAIAETLSRSDGPRSERRIPGRVLHEPPEGERRKLSELEQAQRHGESSWWRPGAAGWLGDYFAFWHKAGDLPCERVSYTYTGDEYHADAYGLSAEHDGDGDKAILIDGSDFLSDVKEKVLNCGVTTWGFARRWLRDHADELLVGNDSPSVFGVTGRIPYPGILGVHTIVWTSDGWCLCGLRDPKQGFYGGAWSLSYEESVSVGPRERIGRPPDATIWDTLACGLEEEWGIPRDRISSTSCLAVGREFVRTSESGLELHSSLLTAATVDATLDDVWRSLDSAHVEDREEHSGWAACRFDSPHAARAFLWFASRGEDWSLEAFGSAAGAGSFHLRDYPGTPASDIPAQLHPTSAARLYLGMQWRMRSRRGSQR